MSKSICLAWALRRGLQQAAKDAKIMFALWPNQMAEFIKTGNQSILKSSLGSASVDLG
ncbi:MAG TPA: hypothetical protein VG498_02680 [Terriglobales bacterium]|nr:hypothetical protein [Terriglobales bacterium]